MLQRTEFPLIRLENLQKDYTTAEVLVRALRGIRWSSRRASSWQ